MNAAYVAIGCAFIAIGGAAAARSRKAADPVSARNSKLSGGLMMLAGLIFALTGVMVGD